MSALPYDTSDPGEDWPEERSVTPEGVTRPVTSTVTCPVTLPGVTLTVTPGDDDADAEGNTRALPAAGGSDRAVVTGARPVLQWLSRAAGSRHLGGGPDGLAAHLANPSPESLRAHLRHAGNADGGARAYHLLVAIPVKSAAKTLKATGKTITRAADILDAVPDSPLVAILVIVVIAVIAAMIWL